MTDDIRKEKSANDEKVSKTQALYQKGTVAEHCGICSMFRPPHGCTTVAGHIRAPDWCKYFEHRQSIS